VPTAQVALTVQVGPESPSSASPAAPIPTSAAVPVASPILPPVDAPESALEVAPSVDVPELAPSVDVPELAPSVDVPELAPSVDGSSLPSRVVPPESDVATETAPPSGALHQWIPHSFQ
jgi:hypothetical protein